MLVGTEKTAQKSGVLMQLRLFLSEVLFFKEAAVVRCEVLIFGEDSGILGCDAVLLLSGSQCFEGM
jgi:hypothetical protein